MKKLTTLLLLASITSIAYSQPCLPEGIIFTTQTQIDSFQIMYPNCTEIEGDVEISGDDIVNLNGLSVLTSIDGNLRIDSNPNLSSLAGLENLHSVNGWMLVIRDNPALTDLSGLESLTKVSELQIGFVSDMSSDGNPVLKSLNGLQNIDSLRSLRISGNHSLTDLSGLDNLVKIENNLSIHNNDSLISLNGLNQLNSILRDIYIASNDTLNSISALGNLEIVGEELVINYNRNLTSLHGLEGISSINGTLEVIGNHSLEDLTGLQNISSIGRSLRIGDYSVGNNSIINLEGLENLTSIGQLSISNNQSLTSISELSNLDMMAGQIIITSNNELASIEGISNIESNSIDNLYIFDNTSLSTCEVLSVCNYLANPNGVIEISNNAPGCNSQQEVEEACASSISEIGALIGLAISPNPFTTSTTISYELQSPQTIRITFYNQFGKLVDRMEQKQSAGKQQVVWTPELPGGVYYFRMEAGDQMASGKVVLVR